MDANATAVHLVRASETKIASACRAKNNYSLQELRDLVRDFTNGGIAGDQLLALIAELAWAGAIRRKRFAMGTPQGDDPAEKFGQDQLEQLKRGERIFVLEGVEQTDGNGNVIGIYGQEVPVAGLMSGGQICSNVGRPPQLWGTKQHGYIPGFPTGGCDGCGPYGG